MHAAAPRPHAPAPAEPSAAHERRARYRCHAAARKSSPRLRHLPTAACRASARGSDDTASETRGAAQAQPEIIRRNPNRNSPRIRRLRRFRRSFRPAIRRPISARPIEDTAVAEKNLQQTSGKQLNAAQQDLVGKIRSFLSQSRDASKDGDWVRAQNLAQKARLLSDELIDSF